MDFDAYCPKMTSIVHRSSPLALACLHCNFETRYKTHLGLARASRVAYKAIFQHLEAKHAALLQPWVRPPG